MNTTADLSQICQAVGLDARALSFQALGNAGGFSGASLWQLSDNSVADSNDDSNGDPANCWCLRRWPAGTQSSRVAWVHTVIRQVAKGLTANERMTADLLAVPRHSADGRTHFVVGSSVFEISPWLRGVADYWQSPNNERLQAAMGTLAAWHLAAADVAIAGQSYQKTATSQGLSVRRERCEQLLAGHLTKISEYAQRDSRTFVRDSAKILVDRFRAASKNLRQQLNQMAPKSWRQQICLRDIWHDHVLFEGDRVTGIVDYDAIRVETAVGDIARLLGSLVSDGETVSAAAIDDSFEIGLAAYESLRPLQAEERQLLSVWDASNAAMSGLQWLEWLCIDSREFEDNAAVRRRLEKQVARAVSFC